MHIACENSADEAAAARPNTRWSDRGECCTTSSDPVRYCGTAAAPTAAFCLTSSYTAPERVAVEAQIAQLWQGAERTAERDAGGVG